MPVLLAALGALLVSLDSAINIALPAMASAFGVAPAAIRWVIICYVLTYACTAFAAGLLADRLGPGPVFTVGLWLCAATFVGYALASSYGQVLLLRVIQGMGSGMVYGTAPALVTLSLPPARHGRGLGTMSLGIGVGLGVGPVLGGLLVDGFGWPAAFVFRAPLFLILALLALTRFGRVAGAAPTPRRLAVADLLRLPVLGAGTLAFLSQYAQFAVWLLMPFFLVTARGLSPSVGGVVFVVTPLAIALAAPLVGAAMALVGFGAGLFQVPNLALMMAAFPPAQQGAAGGLAFLGRTLGSAVGVQATALLFDARLPRDGFLAAFHAAFHAAGLVCVLAVGLVLLPARSSAPRGVSVR